MSGNPPPIQTDHRNRAEREAANREKRQKEYMEKMDKAFDKLDRLNVLTKHCSECGARNWEKSGRLASLVLLDPDDNEKSCRMIAIACKACGHLKTYMLEFLT